MRRSPRKVGGAVGAVLILAGLLTMAAASTASADPPASCTGDIAGYLVSIGVNPTDAANAACQGGMKNYAGPGCPGTGWNCRLADRPIVQIAPDGGTNVFACGSSNCVAAQVIHGNGQNGAGCFRSDKHASSALQVCLITQDQDGDNPNSTNAAGIEQNIQQSNSSRTSTLEARQVARITQVNGAGKNFAHIHQVIGQSQNAKGGSTITQSMEAHQAATVDQQSMSGANRSNIDERQDQTQRGSGTTGLITQAENTELGVGGYTCDRPGDIGGYDQQKNQCAEVLQNSSEGGTTDSDLRQLIRESQTASNAQSVDQDEGTFPGGPFVPSGGQEGTVEQHSSASDDSDATQDTVQVQAANNISSGVDLEDQFKNTGDPRCCQTQTDNTASTADLTQTTNQSAFVNGAFADASQWASLQGHCVTSGTCRVQESATINGETTTNSCEGTFCQVFVECFSGEGTFCAPGEVGGETTPPPIP